MTEKTNRIISEVTNRIAVSMKMDHEAFTEKECAAIYVFLEVHHQSESGIRVVFTREVPLGDYVVTTLTTESGNYILYLGYGKNRQKDKYPNVLFVSINKSFAAKFKAFWQKRNLPEELFEETVKRVSFCEKISITAYKKAGAWNKSRDKNDQVFGQKIAANGNFVPNKPIAYIRGNNVVLTNPRMKAEEEYFSFD